MLRPRSGFLAGTVISAALALAVLAPAVALADLPPARAPIDQATAGACVAGANILCLNNARFAVSVEWKDFSGNTGSGKAVPLTADTGYFWFFTNTNVELVVKVLDAAAINGHFWVFYGALSNVEYTITVTDTVTSAQKVYSNRSGEFGSVGDTLAFAAGVGSPPAAASSDPVELGDSSKLGAPTAAVGPATSAKARKSGCAPDATALCLADGRFRVEVNWRDFQGKTGRGQANGLTADTGYFWFFNSANVELVVKVLDARGVNGNFWVFYGALSNVEYEIVVIDTETGESRRYRNPSGQFASAGDTAAFPLDPGTPQPAYTGVGTPDGAPVTAAIGPAGGSLTSADGNLTLTVPPGALSSTIAFTVQPVTNQAPGGVGQAYRLGPEGQTFATPAQISLLFADPTLAGIPPEGWWVAYQDGQHFWRNLKAVSADQARKTATVSTTHLSDWSRISGFQLQPASATVLVSKSLGLSLVFCKPVDTGDDLSTLMAKCEPSGDLFDASAWAVNGVPGGNGTVGTVVPAGDFGGTYTAPASKPTPDLVAVSARVGGALAATTVVSNVTISEHPEWKGTGSTRSCGDQPLSADATDVTWTFFQKLGSVSQYVASGGTFTTSEGGCTLEPSAGVIHADPGKSVLFIDESTDPPTYSGTGFETFPTTETCVYPPPIGTIVTPQPAFVAIFFNTTSYHPVSADGNTIAGTDGDGQCWTSSWSFARQPPLTTAPR